MREGIFRRVRLNDEFKDEKILTIAVFHDTRHLGAGEPRVYHRKARHRIALSQRGFLPARASGIQDALQERGVFSK